MAPRNSAHTPVPDVRATGAGQWLAWLMLLAGFSALYGPTFFDLFNTLWSTNQNAHGPIVLLVSVWLFLFKAKEISNDDAIVVRPSPALGTAVFAMGLLMYITGRSQSVYVLEVGALVPLLLGTVLAMFGRGVAKRLWFAFFFMCFMVPLPGSLVDEVTQPLKIAVSFGTEHILYWLGYPVARSGVVLLVGQYQLLVADACAGLNSLFTLEALGLLYMNVTRHESAVRNMILAALIVPISMMSNIIRVIILALVTYYFGDAAGQGFVHSFSGMVLFVTALFIIVGVDHLLQFGITQAGRRSGGRAHAQV